MPFEYVSKYLIAFIQKKQVSFLCLMPFVENRKFLISFLLLGNENSTPNMKHIN